MKPVKAGIIGCGNIAGIYCDAGHRFENLEIVACADLVRARAEARAREFGIPKACTPRQLLADKAIEVVVNLTVPAVHHELTMAALEADKHVYSEKPLALTPAQAREIIDLAQSKGLRVGCAPDTFLGAAHQTARKAVDDGWIGEPVAATAFMQCHGHEHWHPDPDFYYQPGGGPLFDMGPYYLTTLINLIGPVRRVSASARITFPERRVSSPNREGEVIAVNTPTHVAGILDFANGAIGTLVTSFDVWRASLHFIEVHGTEGSMQVPDPNGFGGPVRIWRPGYDDWHTLPHSHGYAGNARGLGVADMASALRNDRPHRACAALGRHVLDIMQGFLDASEKRRYVTVSGGVKRPAALPMGLRPGTVE